MTACTECGSPPFNHKCPSCMSRRFCEEYEFDHVGWEDGEFVAFDKEGWPWSKREFAKDSATRCAMEELGALLHESNEARQKES